MDHEKVIDVRLTVLCQQSSAVSQGLQGQPHHALLRPYQQQSLQDRQQLHRCRGATQLEWGGESCIICCGFPFTNKYTLYWCLLWWRVWWRLPGDCSCQYLRTRSPSPHHHMPWCPQRSHTGCSGPHHPSPCNTHTNIHKYVFPQKKTSSSVKENWCAVHNRAVAYSEKVYVYIF